MKKMIVSSTLILSMTAFIINFCACGNKAEEAAVATEPMTEQAEAVEHRAPEEKAQEASEVPEATRGRATQGEVVELSSEADFNQLIAQGNVVVDFYAVWCAPCKALAPVIHNLAQKNRNITFIKVNTESFSGLSSRYGVRSLPTLIFFKDGQKVETLKGSKSEAQLGAELNRIFRR